jgi:hypothetical protein
MNEEWKTLEKEGRKLRILMPDSQHMLFEERAQFGLNNL